MSGYNTEPLMRGMQGTTQNIPSHIFTSNSSVMDDWGLCSFTLDNLDFIFSFVYSSI